MKNLIKDKIKETLNDLGIPETDFVVEIPAEIKNGDYSTNVAFVLSKELKDSPNSIADKIIIKLNEKEISEFSKIEKAGAGFINFYLSDDAIRERVLNPIFKNNILNNQKVLLEFTDPNPFKQFHIGHLMNNTIGEALSRIFEVNGADVKRICYQGDIGLHVAKAIWGIKKHKAFFPQDDDSIDDKAKFLGDSYVYGSSEYEENSDVKKEIDELNKILFDNENVDIETQTYYIKGRKWSLEYFDKMYELLGTKFDKFYLETQSAPIGLEIIKNNLGKIFKESEGAIIYEGEQDGLHTRVFVNSKGVPTYETKDFGLFYLKENDFKPDRSIIITGNEQADYFKVILSAINKIDKKIKEKTTHMYHGMLRFSEGKMSSRKGNIILAGEMIEQMKDLVTEKIKDRDFDINEKNDVEEKVGIAALKYSILKQSIGKDIVFDFDKSISFEGDSGPYLQYTYVRAKSLLKKAKDIKEEKLTNWSATEIERILFKYTDILEVALNDLAPQYIVSYLTLLASEFNSFYSKEKIIDESDPNSFYKIQITKSVMNTLEAGLKVLGISVPQKM
jgi:arginyl-tRNA synthetase